MKIGLIVEGKSDKSFFDDYFKKRFNLEKNIHVVPSGKDNTCKIMNERSIKIQIEALKTKGYKKVYILIDLDSKCKKDIYHCVVELKKDYIAKLKLTSIENLEAWMLSAWKQSDKKSKEDLQQHFSIKSSKNLEEILLKKFIASKEDINPQKNESLRHFFKKLEIA